VLIELLSIFSFRPHQYRKGLRRYPGTLQDRGGKRAADQAKVVCHLQHMAPPTSLSLRPVQQLLWWEIHVDATEQLVSHHFSRHAGCFQRQNLGIVVLFFFASGTAANLPSGPLVSYHCCVSRLCARLTQCLCGRTVYLSILYRKWW